MLIKWNQLSKWKQFASIALAGVIVAGVVVAIAVPVTLSNRTSSETPATKKYNLLDLKVDRIEKLLVHKNTTVEDFEKSVVQNINIQTAADFSVPFTVDDFTFVFFDTNGEIKNLSLSDDFDIGFSDATTTTDWKLIISGNYPRVTSQTDKIPFSVYNQIDLAKTGPVEVTSPVTIDNDYQAFVDAVETQFESVIPGWKKHNNEATKTLFEYDDRGYAKKIDESTWGNNPKTNEYNYKLELNVTAKDDSLVYKPSTSTKGTVMIAPFYLNNSNKIDQTAISGWPISYTTKISNIKNYIVTYYNSKFNNTNLKLAVSDIDVTTKSFSSQNNGDDSGITLGKNVGFTIKRSQSAPTWFQLGTGINEINYPSAFSNEDTQIDLGSGSLRQAIQTKVSSIAGLTVLNHKDELKTEVTSGLQTLNENITGNDYTIDATFVSTDHLTSDSNNKFTFKLKANNNSNVFVKDSETDNLYVTVDKINLSEDRFKIPNATIQGWQLSANGPTKTVIKGDIVDALNDLSVLSNANLKLDATDISVSYENGVSLSNSGAYINAGPAITINIQGDPSSQLVMSLDKFKQSITNIDTSIDLNKITISTTATELNKITNKDTLAISKTHISAALGDAIHTKYSNIDAPKAGKEEYNTITVTPDSGSPITTDNLVLGPGTFNFKIEPDASKTIFKDNTSVSVSKSIAKYDNLEGLITTLTAGGALFNLKNMKAYGATPDKGQTAIDDFITKMNAGYKLSTMASPYAESDFNITVKQKDPTASTETWNTVASDASFSVYTGHGDEGDGEIIVTPNADGVITQNGYLENNTEVTISFKIEYNVPPIK